MAPPSAWSERRQANNNNNNTTTTTTTTTATTTTTTATTTAAATTTNSTNNINNGDYNNRNKLRFSDGPAERVVGEAAVGGSRSSDTARLMQAFFKGGE